MSRDFPSELEDIRRVNAATPPFDPYEGIAVTAPFGDTRDDEVARAFVVADGGTHQGPSTRYVVITPASTMDARSTLWVWADRIPAGNLTLLAGIGGLGKSALACEIAARLSCGQLDGDRGDEPTTVVYVTAEDSWEATLVPRLTAAGADLERLVDVAIEDVEGTDLGMSLPEDAALLREAIEQTGAGFVIIDPLVAFLSDRIDSHKDHSIRRALGALKRLAEETETAILGVVHLNKRDSRQAAERIMGSVGFYNAVRSVLLLTQDPDTADQRVLSHPKSNLAPRAVSLRLGIEPRFVLSSIEERIETVGVAWLGEAPEITADSALEDVQSADERSAVAEASEFLIGELAAGPVAATNLKTRAEANGIAWRTLRRAKGRLAVTSAKDGADGAWRWHAAPEGGQSGQARQGSQSGHVAKGGQTSDRGNDGPLGPLHPVAAAESVALNNTAEERRAMPPDREVPS